MKVIASGVPGGMWKPHLTCTGAGNGKGGCGAILEVSASDLFHTYASYMGRDEDHFVTFECPECKTWTDVEQYGRGEDALPSSVRIKVLNEPISSPSKGIVRSSDARD